MIAVPAVRTAHPVVTADLDDHEVRIERGEVVDDHVRQLVEAFLDCGEHRLELPLAGPDQPVVVRSFVHDVVGAMHELALLVARGEAGEHLADGVDVAHGRALLPIARSIVITRSVRQRRRPTRWG